MDLIALFKTATEMGFDAGQIVMFAVIYWRLRKDLKKGLAEDLKSLVGSEFAKLIGAINQLERTHNERLKKIEDHVGLK